MTITIETTETVTCKNCGSTDVVKFGSYKGVQRYFCKSCQRKFKADADLFHGKVPAEYSSSAVDMYYRGMSLKDIRSHLKQEHDYYPSTSVVYKWVDKFTNLATRQFKDAHPKVGDVWIADEVMLDVDGEHKVWFYDIIDRDTRFLLASRVALTRTTHDAEILMKEAERKAGKTPKEVITDKNYSYMGGIEKAFGKDTEHIQGSPFRFITSGESTAILERFHSTLRDRVKVFRAFRDVETLINFTDGWLVYYNYFKPHESLDGKTPAEAAGLKYTVKDWADLGRIPVAKVTEIEHHQAPAAKIVKVKVSLAKAYKRRRRHAVESGVGVMRYSKR